MQVKCETQEGLVPAKPAPVARAHAAVTLSRLASQPTMPLPRTRF